MAIVNTLADIVLIPSMIMLIVGLINPKAFTNKKTGEVPARKYLATGFGVIIVVCSVVLYLNAPKEQAATIKTSTAPVQQQSVNITPVQPAAKPALRQDLAFQGDASFCDATYKANDNGTTTWTLNIKQAGELITHLSDKSGHIYRHDDKVSVGYRAYTASVNIDDVSEINGLLYIGSDDHPCNIAPAN